LVKRVPNGKGSISKERRKISRSAKKEKNTSLPKSAFPSKEGYLYLQAVAKKKETARKGKVHSFQLGGKRDRREEGRNSP